MNHRWLRQGLRSTLVVGLLASTGAPTLAWQLPTHVGLTQRAVQRSGLDAWLRKQGLGDGLYEVLGLPKRATNEGFADAALLEELTALDAALGATPDHGRQPALAWLVAGTALEGAGMQRVRNHFVDPRTKKGLDEHEQFSSSGASLAGAGRGLTTIRAMLAGGAFDGTGLRADEWVDSHANPLSRPHFLDALYRAHTALARDERAAALARALVCAGSIVHVLEAVGDPAHAHGDFSNNYLVAGAPLAHWVEDRYGMATPPAQQAAAPHMRLRTFFTAEDGTGLADQVARSYASPSSRAGATQSHADVADQLLPRIAAESAALLDFLFRGSLQLSTPRYQKSVMKIDVQIGNVGVGPGEVELYEENADGKRTRISRSATAGGQPGAALVSLSDSELPPGRKLVAVYRGLDGAGEPIVLGAVLQR